MIVIRKLDLVEWVQSRRNDMSCVVAYDSGNGTIYLASDSIGIDVKNYHEQKSTLIDSLVKVKSK